LETAKTVRFEMKKHYSHSTKYSVQPKNNHLQKGNFSETTEQVATKLLCRLLSYYIYTYKHTT